MKPIVASFTRRYPMRERTLGPVEQRDASRLPSLPAEYVRHADDRCRLSTKMPCAAGDRLLVSCVWTDGESGFAVTVYAVHAGRNLIDVAGWLEDERPTAIRLRKSSL